MSLDATLRISLCVLARPPTSRGDFPNAIIDIPALNPSVNTTPALRRERAVHKNTSIKQAAFDACG